MLSYPPGDWHFIMTVPADAEDEYAVVVPTLADSTVEGGIYYSTFFVRARTGTPGVYFDSYPDSGYSLDNLAPAPPPNLRMPSQTEVAWNEAPEEDFDYFSVYGSDAPGFDETAVLIGYTIDLVMDVSEYTYAYYHVTATDFSGNEGGAASIENTYASLPQEGLPALYALRQNYPNPFAGGTAIAFDLPRPDVVTLRILNVQGRVVKVLTDDLWPAGRHSMTWHGDDDKFEQVGPGIYFARMETADFQVTIKMLLAR